MNKYESNQNQQFSQPGPSANTDTKVQKIQQGTYGFVTYLLLGLNICQLVYIFFNVKNHLLGNLADFLASFEKLSLILFTTYFIVWKFAM